MSCEPPAGVSGTACPGRGRLSAALAAAPARTRGSAAAHTPGAAQLQPRRGEVQVCSGLMCLDWCASSVPANQPKGIRTSLCPSLGHRRSLEKSLPRMSVRLYRSHSGKRQGKGNSPPR